MFERENKNLVIKKYKAFSLIEMIVAIFVFSLVIAVVISAYVSIMNADKKAKAVQQNVENARYAMELMAKTFRTSAIIGTPTASTVRVFDYSQVDSQWGHHRCLEYTFSGNNLSYKISNDYVDMRTCESGPSWSSVMPMLSGTLRSGQFLVVPTGSAAGKVTIAMDVCPAGGCSGAAGDDTKLQTTVSLQDWMPNYKETSPS